MRDAWSWWLVLAFAPWLLLVVVPEWWLAATAVTVVAATVHLLHRRRELRRWEDELDAAFEVGPRRDLSLHRTL